MREDEDRVEKDVVSRKDAGCRAIHEDVLRLEAGRGRSEVDLRQLALYCSGSLLDSLDERELWRSFRMAFIHAAVAG